MPTNNIEEGKIKNIPARSLQAVVVFVALFGLYWFVQVASAKEALPLLQVPACAATSALAVSFALWTYQTKVYWRAAVLLTFVGTILFEATSASNEGFWARLFLPLLIAVLPLFVEAWGKRMTK